MTLHHVADMNIDLENNRLYWLNSGSATIQYLDLNHTNANITTVETGWGSRPSALALHRGELVWADSASSALRACRPPNCDNPRSLLAAPHAGNVPLHHTLSHWGSRPSALALHRGELVWADSASSALRACRPPNCDNPRSLLAAPHAGNVPLHHTLSHWGSLRPSNVCAAPR
ncbi:hypothetical protein evm_014010 [Chilo suppressalis]|nr:hypothetical protein evm_014010 [Chilo suppressalis]